MWFNFYKITNGMSSLYGQVRVEEIPFNTKELALAGAFQTSMREYLGTYQVNSDLLEKM